MKKRIGISFTTTNLKYYWNWFNQHDLQDDVELVDLSFQKNNVEDIYACDGFILTGGVDIDPSFYGGELDYANKPKAFQQDRDKFEAKIFEYTQANNKPLLGICRGLQLVNVLLGGKLIQDLKETGNKKHQSDRQGDKLHNINIVKDTLLYSLARSCNGQVNSAHHQAIVADAIGNNLMVNAYADLDGKLIEGVEFKDKTNKAFMLCVQWHPERMPDTENVFTKNIKSSFLEAVRSSI